MRVNLLYNPRLLCERLAVESLRRRRLKKLKGTGAVALREGHLDSLEFFEIIRDSQPRVLYDIGANVGTWSLLAKACLPNSVIHAFEPLKLHHEGFFNTTRNIPDMALHSVAVGSHYSMLDMHVTSFSDASSLLEISDASVEHFNLHKERDEKVTVVPLDDYVVNERLPLPDLVKLDVQGYELEALRGSERCLEHAKFIICEVSFIEFYRGQALFPDIVEFLHKHGFNLLALGVNTPLGKKLYQTDALFARESSSAVSLA
jgi:FkbM family methyltransferase